MGLFSFFKRNKIASENSQISVENSIETDAYTQTECEEPISMDEEDHVSDNPIVEILEDEISHSHINREILPESSETLQAINLTEEQEEIQYVHLEDYDPKLDLSSYNYPSLELFFPYEPSFNEEEIELTKQTITDIFLSNKIKLLSITVNVGYINTLYEIQPQLGVRASRIKSLETDLAFALLAPNLKIELLIDRGRIGIIVPNKTFKTLPIHPIIASETFQNSDFILPLIIGRTMQTENFVIDLTKHPHIIIAGATGQGKSVLLNIIITSLLYKKHPAELKLILVDTKALEFNLYKPLENHFLAKTPEANNSIVTTIDAAKNTFESLCIETDLRYDLLRKAGVRKIEEYNIQFKKRRLNPEKGHRFLPYLVAIIDEYFDLAIYSNDIAACLIKLTRKAHIVGIHIILSTQRPTKDIIRGDLKTNFPVHIAFKVASSLESRIIIDKNGAESLSGKGDALYVEGINQKRIQVPFINTEEIESIVSSIHCQQGYPHTYFLPQVENINTYFGYYSGRDINVRDPLFEDAARLIVLHQQGSTSLIQRKFIIGYNRAGIIMDQLEKAGIVGYSEGSKAREVLVRDENELEVILGTIL